MFRSPVDTDEVYDYMDYVDDPMDFDMMLTKLDEAQYNCAQDFLDDIDLIADNALKYNSDLQYETNKIICHRARALIDFSYALVKAEMDTDFEDECKEIVTRRKKLTKELEELSGDDDEQEGANNGTHTDGNSSVGASRKKRKPMRKSAWAKGCTPKRKPRPKEDEDDEDQEEDDDNDGNEEERDEEPSAADTSVAPTPTRASSRTRSGVGATPTPSTSAASAAVVESRKAVSDGSSGGSTRSSPKDLAPSTSATPSTR